MQEALKELIAACKGQLDLLAFIGVGILTAAVAIGTKSVSLTVVFAMVMSAIWIGMRYALYQIQSKERLRNIRYDSLHRSGQILTDRVPDDELDLIVGPKKQEDTDNER